MIAHNPKKRGAQQSWMTGQQQLEYGMRERAYWNQTNPMVDASQNGEPQRLKVARSQLVGKMKSKLDIYRILTKEGQFFLPPFNECTMDFIGDVIQGKKKVRFT